MITHLDNDYLEAKLVKQGRKQLTYPIKDLAEWISERYRVPVVNIHYDIIEFDNRPRLNVALEFEEDVFKFKDHWSNYLRDRQAAIAGQWRTLVYEAARETRDGVTFYGKDTKYRTDNILPVFSGFDRCAKSEANSAIPKEAIEKLQRKINSSGDILWLIDRFGCGVTFFFHTETQADHFKQKQHLQRISEAYFELLQPYDEFGYFERETFRVHVDSKEKLDRVCNGSLMNYYR